MTAYHDFLPDALAWSARGIHVFPHEHGDRSQPHVRWGQYRATAPSKRQLGMWFRNKHVDMSIICQDGLVCIDFDTLPLYVRWKVQHPELAGTYSVKSRRGVHVYLIVADDIPRGTVAAEPHGIDLKYNGMSITAEHSLHQDGVTIYTRLAGDPDHIVMVKQLADAIELRDAANTTAAPYPSVPIAPVGGAPVGCTGSLIGAVRKALPILDYCAQHGIVMGPLNERGYTYGLCQLHDDSTPSFYANTRLGTCGCMAQSCIGYKTMNVISFHAALTNQTFVEALHDLARDLGLWQDYTPAQRQQYAREAKRG